jgi:hypothetical protein
MVLGAWRARVIVPADFASRYTPEERCLMLAHEQAHLARGDAIANAAAAAWLCLFWFNPLMYWAVGRLQFDQELACDARVVSRRAAARKLYAGALLKAQLPTEPAWRMPIGCHWQSSHPLKERIAALKYPPPGAGRRLSGAALAVALSASGIYAVTFASGTALAQRSAASSAPNGTDRLDQRISIQVRDQDVREALRMVAQESGQKIFFSGQAAEKLKEKLTMHFVDMKARDCLDLLLKTQGLVYRQSGGVIFVDVPR